MRTLIEYCNTDISNIKFIILNMFEKVAKHSCKELSNAAQIYIYIYIYIYIVPSLEDKEYFLLQMKCMMSSSIEIRFFNRCQV